MGERRSPNRPEPLGRIVGEEQVAAEADRLVAKGCVKRTRDDEEDRRRVFVELDKKGEKIYQALLESEMEMIITMMDALTPAEQDALLDALGKAMRSLGR